MATAGILNGTLIKVKVGGTTIDNLKTNGESFKKNMIETTNKDTSGNATFIPGKFESTIDFDVFDSESATVSYADLFGYLQAGTSLSLEIGSGVSGDTKFTMSAYIMDLKRTAGTEDAVTATGTFQVTGAVTCTTY